MNYDNEVIAQAKKEQLVQNQKEIRRLAKLDELLFEKRDKKIYRSKDRVSRTLWYWKTYSFIKINRRRYNDIRSGKSAYLLDKYYDWEPKTKFQGQINAIVLLSYNELNSYSKIVKYLFKGQVSRQQIHYFMKKGKYKIVLDKKFYCDQGILYLNIDGVHPKYNASSKKHHIKFSNFFTKTSQKNGINYLDQKTGFVTIQDNTNKLAKEVTTWIDKFYENVQEVRVVGDGATWIKNLAKEIIGKTYYGKYYMDTFHFVRAIHQLGVEYKIAYPKLYNELTSNASGESKQKWLIKKIFRIPLKRQIYCSFIKTMKGPIAKIYLVNKVTGELTLNNTIGVISLRRIKYITNNIDYFIRTKDHGVRSSIEGTLAHYVGTNFKNKRKGWSPNCLVKLINVIYAKKCKLNIIFEINKHWEKLNNDMYEFLFGIQNIN